MSVRALSGSEAPVVTEILCEALAKATAEGYLGTDDAELVERLGVVVDPAPEVRRGAARRRLVLLL